MAEDNVPPVGPSRSRCCLRSFDEPCPVELLDSGPRCGHFPVTTIIRCTVPCDGTTPFSPFLPIHQDTDKKMVRLVHGLERQTSSCDDNGNVVVVRDERRVASWHQQSVTGMLSRRKTATGDRWTICTTNWHHANGINMMHGNVLAGTRRETVPAEEGGMMADQAGVQVSGNRVPHRRESGHRRGVRDGHIVQNHRWIVRQQ